MKKITGVRLFDSALSQNPFQNRTRFDDAGFEFEPELGFITITSKDTGATASFPNHYCILEHEKATKPAPREAKR